ncbi:MAG: alpha/beta hydrolase [Gemmatimonadota bacterium]
MFRRSYWLGVLVFPALLVVAGRVEATKARAVRFADVVLETGVRLRYATRGDSLGEPIIFLHSYTDSWFSFSEVLPRLSPRYRAFALDQRGHGGSERPDSGYTMRDFAQDVVAFMDAMKLKEATIVGHSMGSLVAREVAALVPRRITRLVLVGAPATGTNASVSGLAEAIEAMQDSIPGAFVQEFQASTIHKPVSPEFLKTVVSESQRVPARVWRAVLEGIVDPRDPWALKGVTFPTLIVWGAEDTYFPKPEQDLLVRAIPNAKLLVYQGTGHAPHWERPTDFVKDLEVFLK